MKTENKKVGGWSPAQVVFFTSRLKKEWSVHWSVLARPLRIAVVEAFVLQLVFQQESETVEIEKIRELCRALHEKMGSLNQ